MPSGSQGVFFPVCRHWGND